MDNEIIAVISIFLFVLTLIYISTFYKETSTLDRFVTRLPIASHFIIGVGIYITYLIFRLNYQDSIIKETVQAIKDTFNQTLDVLERHKDSCPNLIKSFFFSWQKPNSNKYESLKEEHDKEDDYFNAMILSNYIFQIAGLYIKASTMTSISDSKYLIFFSNFFKSKLLKSEWDKYYINFGINTQLLCDKLFEINEKNNFKNAEELKVYFDKYVETDEFIELMTRKDYTNVMQKSTTFF
jgi:hypothetical protein